MFGPIALGLTALLLYLAAEGFSIAHLRWDKASYGIAATVLLVAGFLVQFLALEVGGRITHTVPYHDLPASMSLFAWMLAGSYCVLLWRHREGSTGPFLIPLIIVFLMASLLLSNRTPGPILHDPKLSGALFAFHVTLAIFGYSALTLSFVLAQLYLIQNRQIHRRKMGILFSRLPALDVISSMHRTSVAIGVFALTVASVLGLVWAKQNWGTYWDPKVAFTFLLIGLYLVTLFPRWIGWGGKKVAFLSIAGFVLLMFSYTIVNLFISLEHVFH
ncbi:MAG TPA: cytochrome c biogenesis protein CcsA [Geothrix sp.]|nr:cytochrome c biogenesis protein CcsA [Geothrix sp.]